MRGAPHGHLWRALAAFLVSTSAMAQALPTTTETPNDYPAALPVRKGQTPPALVIKVVGEVALPASPTGEPLSLEGNRVFVPVRGGTASVDLAEPMTARLEDATAPAADAPSPWVVSADGNYRVRTLPAGRVEAEKRGMFRHRFGSQWSLRAPGATPAVPLIMGRRVFFGSVDDQLYCVRRKNGHRLWAVDLEDRISKPVAAWHRRLAMPATASGTTPDVDVEMVLVVPDGGASLLALDVYDGSRLGSYEVPAGKGTLATSPLVLPDGRIAIARESYGSGAGALLLLAPEVSEAPPKSGPK